MPLKKTIFILHLFSVCWFNTTAQFRFERIGNQQGLSQSTIIKIFQDKKGFIWFATRDGLNKYDGYDFTIYRHIFNNPNSLSSSNITCITEDLDENLWVGTADGGINKMDKKTGNFVHFKHTDDKKVISNLSISSIIVTKDNQILATMFRQGMLKFDIQNSSITWVNLEMKSDKSSYFSQVYQDKQQNIFLGGSNGIFKQITKRRDSINFKIGKFRF